MIPAYLIPFTQHLWQSTLFAAIAAALVLVLRSNSARVRHALWLCASCKFLLPFSFLTAVGSQWHWPDSAPAATAIVHQATRLAMPDLLAPAPIATVSAGVVKSARNWTPELLFAIWVCGAAAVLFRWGSEWLRIRAIVRAAKPLALDIPIRVRSTTALLEPGVFGIARPVLLLPEGIQGRLSSSEFAAILAHELCHVRRRDNFTAMVQMLIEATFWFHPLVWWLSAKLVDERERACDEEVLRQGSEPAAYAEGILKVCEFYLESPSMCVSGVTGSDLRKRITEIMRGSSAQQIGWAKKALLTSAGIGAIAVPVVIGMIDTPALRAQPTSSKTYSFEVASVKENVSDERRIRYQFLPGGRFSATNMPLDHLISAAYDLPLLGGGARLSGGPDWIRAHKFDVEAIAEKSAIAGDKTVKARQDKMRLMLQTLLAERFKLVIRREVKELPVYAITVAKGGPKLEPSKIDEKDCAEDGGDGVHCHEFNGGMGRGLHGQAVTMTDLLFVGNWTDRPVIDRTGLKGLYKIETDGWAPMQPREGNDSGRAEDGVAWSERQTIFTIFEKLGLKLEAQKAPIEMIVIENAQKPVEN